MKRLLITGGAGFLGHHVVEHVLKNTDWDIVVLDRLSYSSNGLERLRDISCFNIDRVLILSTDFSMPLSEGIRHEIGDVDYIYHIGAESHVDKSIENPTPFVMSNVVGTMHILDFARTLKNLKLFVMFSTDEVYGPAPEGIKFKETDRYNCTNPYAATKAGAEQLANAYANTYKLPIIVTNTMNIFGERQHKEKFIPLCINRIINDEVIYIHSNPELTKAGSRHWIHARNVADALLFLTDNYKVGERYNIVGEVEVDNMQMAQIIGSILEKKPKLKMINFHESRPGHDLRYALDGSKLAEIGWMPTVDFNQSLEKTVKWFVNNPTGLERCHKAVN